MTTGLAAALNSNVVGYTVIDSVNPSVVNSSVSTSDTQIYSNPVGTIAGIKNSNATILPSISNGNQDKTPVFYSVNAYSNADPTPSQDVQIYKPQLRVPSITLSNPSTNTVTNFNGKLNAGLDSTNQSQLISASTLQASASFNPTTGLKSSIPANIALALKNQTTNASNISPLTSNAQTTTTSSNASSQVATLFPGIKVPGTSSVLNNNDAAIRAQQLSTITLPASALPNIAANAANGISTATSGVVSSVTNTTAGAAAPVLSAAQLRLQSLTQTSITQGIAGGISLANNQLYQSVQASAMTAVGAATNMPGSASSLTATANSLGNNALVSKVKAAEANVNAAVNNVLTSTNNLAKKAEAAVTGAVQGAITAASFRVAAPAVSAAVQAATNSLKSLVNGIPFVGSIQTSLSGLSLTQVTAKIGSFGTSLFGTTATMSAIDIAWLNTALQTQLESISTDLAVEVSNQLAIDLQAQVTESLITAAAGDIPVI